MALRLSLLVMRTVVSGRRYGTVVRTPAELPVKLWRNDVHVMGVSSLAAGHKTFGSAGYRGVEETRS